MHIDPAPFLDNIERAGRASEWCCGSVVKDEIVQPQGFFRKETLLTNEARFDVPLQVLYADTVKRILKYGM